MATHLSIDQHSTQVDQMEEGTETELWLMLSDYFSPLIRISRM